MGRSQLQGTPWHYEYAESRNIKNSKNCTFNTGQCSNKLSQYYKQECVGKIDCDEFERSLFNQNKTNKKRKTNKNTSKSKTTNTPTKTNNVKENKVVSVGDKILLTNLITKEKIEIKVTDPKNPFVGQKIPGVKTVMEQQYKIEKIKT